MSIEADKNELLARIGAMARTIQRFSTWVAGAALVVGVIALAALWPWLSGPAAPGFAVAVALAVVLVGAPLRVIWHGQRISAIYGHPGQIEQALESVPGALHEATVALQAVVDPPGRGLRRVIGTWQSLMAVQDVWESSPAVERLQALVEPVHPDRLGVTMVAVWVSLGTLLLGLPVAFLSLVVLALA